jgi:hypothetical protein
MPDSGHQNGIFQNIFIKYKRNHSFSLITKDWLSLEALYHFPTFSLPLNDFADRSLPQ